MSGSLRRYLLFVGLLACVTPFAGCRNDKTTVRILETQKVMVLDTTRPKAEFWDAVGRKGEALKKENAVAEELAGVRQQIGADKASLEQARKQLESARTTNAKAADVLSGQLAQLDKVEGTVAKQQAELAGFRERQRRGDGS